MVRIRFLVKTSDRAKKMRRRLRVSLSTWWHRTRYGVFKTALWDAQQLFEQGYSIDIVYIPPVGLPVGRQFDVLVENSSDIALSLYCYAMRGYQIKIYVLRFRDCEQDTC